MGCDIHAVVEVLKSGGWEVEIEDPFPYQNYGLFGFLANVRNYSNSESIAPDRGIPANSPMSEEWFNDPNLHSCSHVYLNELLNFDYNKVFWDRRVMRQEGPNYWNGAALANPGEGRHISYKEFLGESYFELLDKLKELELPFNVRIVFCFDN